MLNNEELYACDRSTVGSVYRNDITIKHVLITSYPFSIFAHSPTPYTHKPRSLGNHAEISMHVKMDVAQTAVIRDRVYCGGEKTHGTNYQLVMCDGLGSAR